MKLLRLKLYDEDGFRSLPAGFEHHFRTEWALQDELAELEAFAPFVCAGPNGSGKSNLLEVLAAIFFQLEVQRVRRSFLPEALLNMDANGAPDAFELEYLIKLPSEPVPSNVEKRYAHVQIRKEAGQSPQIRWTNAQDFPELSVELSVGSNVTERERDFLLPQFVLGYSSGENEILSLPFFKMRFVQFDEYWNCMKEQLSYPGRPETRLAYLDNGFSQAILLCNLLFQDAATLQPFREDVGIEELKEFRIIIRRSITVPEEFARGFGDSNPAVSVDEASGMRRINLMQLLEAGQDSAANFDPVVTRLKRCATCEYIDEATDTLILDFWVNDATRKAFRDNFDHSALALFQAFQVLLTLNLYSVSEALKTDLYQSSSHYVSETVPTLASDQRVMRFKFVRFNKQGISQPIMLKELSDGEHQLLHSLGLCLLFRNTNSLFLLDEPETHFNPDWRSKFISRLRQCLLVSDSAVTEPEMLVTTHTPFLISDSKPEKVLVFRRDPTDGSVRIDRPGYNTLGASINKITMSTFGKRETIGGYAQGILDGLRSRFEHGEDKEALVAEIDHQLGDSVEKVLLLKVILDSIEAKD
jgi:restriction system-associated AAA family ATPase